MVEHVPDDGVRLRPWTKTTFALLHLALDEGCKLGTDRASAALLGRAARPTFRRYLVQRNLSVPVQVHGGEEGLGHVPQPHKHEALRNPLLQLHQLQLEEEHRAAGDSSGSVLAVSPVRWDDHLSALAHTHPAQTLLQTRDQLVRSQGGEGGRLKLVSENGEDNQRGARARQRREGRSRGVEEGSVHQGAVIAILNQIVGLAGRGAVLGLVDHPDLHRILGVVEVNDVDVKDQDGGAGDEFSWGRNAEKR